MKQHYKPPKAGAHQRTFTVFTIGWAWAAIQTEGLGQGEGDWACPPVPLVIRNPLALCHVSHTICGGKHPPNFTVMGMTECEALPAPAWDGRQGAEAALVSRGTTVPLSPTENAFPR